MPMLAAGDDARLLWYMHHAHGSGASYNVVTITGVRDGAAWERLARRIQTGDLREWTRELDTYRHDVTAKTLLPVDWSPIQEVDFATVPTDGREHELHLFMEDTGWPTSSLDDYITAWDEIYRQPLLAYADDMRAIPIDIQACFQNAHGSSLRREAMLWQYIPDPQTVAHLLTTDLPFERRAPGTYMYDALRVSRPVEEPTVAHRGLVTALLTRRARCRSTIARCEASTFPDRHANRARRRPSARHRDPSRRTRARRAST